MSDNITTGVGDPRSFEERVFARFDAMDGRFNAVDARFNAMDARFDGVDARLDGLDARMTSMEENVGARFALVDLRLERLEQVVDKRLLETQPIWESVQFELRRLNARFDQVIQEIFDLRADQSVLRKRVDVLEGITT